MGRVWRAGGYDGGGPEGALGRSVSGPCAVGAACEAGKGRATDVEKCDVLKKCSGRRREHFAALQPGETEK